MPMEEEMSWYIALSSLMSTGMETEVMIARASARARLKAEMMTTGWMLRSSWGRAWARISPAGNESVCQLAVALAPIRGDVYTPSIITVVVPSPTSSSWVLLSSIILFAAGCETSISRRIAWPSFVRTIPPIGSRSILSMALGPRHDLMMSATLYETDVSLCCLSLQQEPAFPSLAMTCARTSLQL